MSGFGADLEPDQINSPSVIGSLNKPFTSDLLIKTVENYMPKDPNESAEPQIEPVEQEQSAPPDETAWATPVWPQDETPPPTEAEPVAMAEPIWSDPDPVGEAPIPPAEPAEIASAAGGTSAAWWSAPVAAAATSWETPAATAPASFQSPDV